MDIIIQHHYASVYTVLTCKHATLAHVAIIKYDNT